jgi:hypothetical protein
VVIDKLILNSSHALEAAMLKLNPKVISIASGSVPARPQLANAILNRAILQAGGSGADPSLTPLGSRTPIIGSFLFDGDVTGDAAQPSWPVQVAETQELSSIDIGAAVKAVAQLRSSGGEMAAPVGAGAIQPPASGMMVGMPDAGRMVPGPDITLPAASSPSSGAFEATVAPLAIADSAGTATIEAVPSPLATAALAQPSGFTLAAAATVTNPIVLENQKQGTPQTAWQVDPGQDSNLLQGFTTAISTNVGGTVQFKINNLTGNSNYQINIYRLGYYGGDGARLVTTVQHTGKIVQPAPLTNAATGEVDAGNWSVTDAWAVPATSVSGVYVANVVQGSQVFQIPFIVKDPNSTSAIVFQTADETWQAYNGWGGANLYGGNGPAPASVGGLGAGAAYAVSYNRPLVTRDSVGVGAGPQDTVFGAEYSAIYWLEQNGYDVSYISGLDTSTNGSLLLNHKIFMDAGHDEYWTASQVANVQAAAKAGVNLAFLSGNEIFWQTRFAPSIDPSATANRTLISYKDTHFQKIVDPNGTGTGTFQSPPNMGGAGLPSNALTGTLFQIDGENATPGNGLLQAITVPYGYTKLRIWRNTSVASTPVGQTANLAADVLGYEWDSAPDNGFQPVGLINLSSTTVTSSLAYNTAFGNVDTSGTATHNLVEYRDPTSGALVFGAGTVMWSWGLADQSDPTDFGNPLPADPSIQQAMVNLFADMGVQPATLQASLAIATRTTDQTPPSSTISNVSTRTPVEGQQVTVTGTALDSGGGVIARVIVSTDGGKTWHPATSQVGAASESWSYTFAAPQPGTFTIQSRAVDDSLNLQSVPTSISYTVSPSSALSLFGSAVPATANVNDKAAVEVGFKFSSSTNGQITGIRFYKGALNTGTHIVDLWTSAGTLLATAASTNETASGWQQVNFSTPVKISAGLTYVASYHSSGGEYSDTPYYFDTLQSPTHGSLSATPNGLNGVFAYSSGTIFPSNVATFGDNYWVDVVFNDTSQNPQVQNVSGLTVTENSNFTISASSLLSLAQASDPKGLALSLSGVSNGVNGSVSYNASAQTVTFTPAPNFAGPANFTFTVSDTSGATGSAQAAINVAYPKSAQSIFGTSDTPSEVNSNDNHPVEVGVRFTPSVTGSITGIRFYKGSLNTGTHIADLWSSTGALLATATFSAETASGWQQVNFASPIVVTGGTTYVASYHTAGDYSDTPNYFVNPVVNGQLTAPVSNGVYAYGSSPVFPQSTFGASNYWVDVVFNGVPSPIAQPDSGFVVSKNGSITIAGSTLLANDSDTGGLQISLTGASNAVNGNVSFDSTAKSVTFVPTAGYSGTASFSYTIADSGGGTASGSVSLLVKDASAESLFSSTSVPSIINSNDPDPVELGVKFTASANGLISGLRFYKGPQNTGAHVADLWSSTGTLLATATFTNENASGWQQVSFAAPVSIAAGTTYVASYHTSGNYSVDTGYFNAAVTSGHLTAPAGANGVYAYGGGSIFPTSTYQSSNYWVDVVYTSSPVANSDGGFVVNQGNPITISATTLLANDTDPSGLPLSVTGVSGASNGTVTYNATNKTATFVPNAGFTGAASFAYSIADSGGATAVGNVSLLVTDPTTASLFNPATSPAVSTVNDSSPIELGIKFQASSNGTITGIRFYKGPQNVGTHVADLWTSTGTLLTSATFSNETATGWQQANFAAPVAITAGTTYVASYHTNTGEYSSDAGLLANAITNGPLTAPSSTSSGGNGVFAYGAAGLFPTNSFNSTSYGVDVVFKPQLTG